jgi:molecular chaperone Hsp33
MDEIIRAVSSDGLIKIAAISSKNLTERARQIHKTLTVVTAALGRTMAAASILGNALKEQNGSVTVRINGGGPIGSIIVVSDAEGNVRGTVQNPHVDLPRKPGRKLDVGAAVGKNGMLTVVRDLCLKEPYVGSVQLVSGEIAEDFTAYFTESEQTPAACALGVLVDTDQSVIAAGGYIVQMLPGASDELAARLEENIRNTGAVTTVLQDHTPEELIRRVLKGFVPRILQRDKVEYRCYCSRAKVVVALSSMTKEELHEMEQEGKPVEVTCQFCDDVYTFSSADLKALQNGREED